MAQATPGPAHVALMADLEATLSRYASMPAVERCAVLAQFLGFTLSDVPTGQYTTAEIMASVARNIAAGNAAAAIPHGDDGLLMPTQ